MARPERPPPGLAPEAVERAREALAHCFGCGPENPHGLHLAAKQEGPRTVVEFQGSRAHAGWDTVYHGGILAALIDETAAFGLFQGGRSGFAMTRRMSIEYRRRVHWTRPVRLVAEEVHRDAERVLFRVEVLQDGELCTLGEVEFRPMAGPPPRGA